jgi:glycosyltransferase involved in cell wall biosynthesis
LTTNAGLRSQDIPLHEWVPLADNHRVMYFPYQGYIHYSFSLPYLHFLVRHIQAYDVVHFSGVWNFPVIWGPIIARWYGVPYVMTLHGALYPELYYQGNLWFKRIHYFALLRRNLSKASAVHCTTGAEQNSILSFTRLRGLPITVIPYGLSNDVPDAKDSLRMLEAGHTKTILFIGRIHKIKGLDILFSAFSKLIDKDVSYQLLCVGPDDDNYRQQIEPLLSARAKERVVFTGMLSGADKVAAFNAADMFVLPSYSENFGMTVIEAAKYKVPMIISNKVGLAEEVLQHQAGLVINTDVDALLDAIQTLSNDDALAQRLVFNAYEMFEQQFQISQVAQAFHRLYQGLIS